MKVRIAVILFKLLFIQQIAGDALKVNLYYEALCEGCQEFIVLHLYRSFPKLKDYIELDFTPYGNTQRRFDNGTWIFECQHGQEECTLNKLEACGLAKSDDITKKVEFVYCIESQASSKDVKSLAQCSSKLGLPASLLLECALGPEGNKLLEILADKQEILAPNHQYVPWLTFNYKHDENTTKEALTNFFETVCKLLSPPKPIACKRSDSNEIPE